MGYDYEATTGLLGLITDIRDIYCDGCRLRKEYMDEEHENWACQYPQDDNYYVQQYDRVSLLEVIGISV